MSKIKRMKYRSIDAMIEIQASHGIYEKAYKNAYQKKKKSNCYHRLQAINNIIQILFVAS